MRRARRRHLARRRQREVDGVPGAIGAFVAEMDFGLGAGDRAALHAAMDAARDRLPADRARGRRCAARPPTGSAGRYGWAVEPAAVQPVADVIAGLELMLRALLPTRRAGDRADARVHAVPRRPAACSAARSSRCRCTADRRPLRARPRRHRRAFEGGGGPARALQPVQPGRPRLDPGGAARGRARSSSGTAAACSPTRSTRRSSTPAHRHIPYARVSEAAAAHTVTATSAPPRRGTCPA